MKPARLLCAGLLLVAAAIGPAQADDAANDPVKLVRTLQLLQDSIAHGGRGSDGAQQALIRTIAERFRAADATVWSEPRNANAALLYVLSGGDPTILQQLPRDDAELASLTDAIHAYATGAEAEAASLWSAIDVSTLPRAMIGPAALVKANLLIEENPEEALRLLDLARLESPGTLIEEAAVRRGIAAAAAVGDTRRFEFLSIRYATRFPHSMYAAAFRQRFSESYLAMAANTDESSAPRLDEILAPLPERDRRDIFLEIARLALIEGKTALVISAAESAIALSSSAIVEGQRGELYRAAAQVVEDDPVTARAMLELIDAAGLNGRDRALRTTALALAEEVVRWPGAPAAEPPAAAAEAGRSAASADVAISVTTVIARARDVLAAAEDTLSQVE